MYMFVSFSFDILEYKPTRHVRRSKSKLFSAPQV